MYNMHNICWYTLQYILRTTKWNRINIEYLKLCEPIYVLTNVCVYSY